MTSFFNAADLAALAQVGVSSNWTFGAVGVSAGESVGHSLGLGWEIFAIWSLATGLLAAVWVGAAAGILVGPLPGVLVGVPMDFTVGLKAGLTLWLGKLGGPTLGPTIGEWLG